MPSSTPAPGTQTFGLISCCKSQYRAALFYASRKYLLRHLYHDLHDLSANSASGNHTTCHIIRRWGGRAGDPADAVDHDDHDRHTEVAVPLFAFWSVIFAVFFGELHALLLAGVPGVGGVSPAVSPVPSHSLVLSQPQACSLHPVSCSRTQQICSASLTIYLTPNLIALSYVPLPGGMQTHSVLASTLSHLTVIGIVILGALSGLGAIDTA